MGDRSGREDPKPSDTKSAAVETTSTRSSTGGRPSVPSELPQKRKNHGHHHEKKHHHSEEKRGRHHHKHGHKHHKHKSGSRSSPSSSSSRSKSPGDHKKPRIQSTTTGAVRAGASASAAPPINTSDPLAQKALAYLSKRNAQISLLSDEDFYDSHHQAEFREWLLLKRNIYIDQLTGDESKKLFSTFVEQWNSGSLPEDFYNDVLFRNTNSRRTSYQWKFKDLDNDTLGEIKTSVAKATDDVETSARPARPVPQPEARPQLPERPPVPPEIVDQAEWESRQEALRYERQRATKQKRSTDAVVLDELAPKETGHQAIVAKKIARREERRARDDSPDMAVYDDSLDPRSSAEAQFAAMKRSQQMHQARFDKEKMEKSENARKKELAHVQALREMAASFQARGGKIPERPEPEVVPPPETPGQRPIFSRPRRS
ncbi:peptidyl-prolyl cis-trans isomerase G [Pelomyxa schiedti]|nr:peptidyl-prolyl cis-trans isomerase G [Pelomyxa schiedti]